MNLPWTAAARLHRALAGLRSADPHVRCAAAEKLGQLRIDTPEVHASLVQAITDPDRNVRVDAHTALLSLKPELEALRRVAAIAENDSDAFIRSEVATGARSRYIQSVGQQGSDRLTALSDLPELWDRFRKGGNDYRAASSIKALIAMCLATKPLADVSLAGLRHVLLRPALLVRPDAPARLRAKYHTDNRDQWRVNSDIRCEALKHLQLFGSGARPVILESLTISAESYDEEYLHAAFKLLAAIGLGDPSEITTAVRSAALGMRASNPRDPFRDRPERWAVTAIEALGSSAIAPLESLLAQPTDLIEGGILRSALRSLRESTARPAV